MSKKPKLTPVKNIPISSRPQKLRILKIPLNMYKHNVMNNDYPIPIHHISSPSLKNMLHTLDQSFEKNK